MGKAYFLSDLHLGATYGGGTLEVEKRVVSFLDSIKDEAGEIYLLGDILDYWFEYRHVVPRGYVRFFGKLAELSDRGIKIVWIIGNHDIWIFNYLPSELGIDVVDGVVEREINGTWFSLQHGDALGGTRKFKIIRKIFRNKICQKLYSGIHPRWTVGFAHAWSKNNRIKENAPGYKGPDLIEDIRKWCIARVEAGDPAKYYIFGHLHRLHDEPLLSGKRLIVLPAWPEKGGYGVFDGENFAILYYS